MGNISTSNNYVQHFSTGLISVVSTPIKLFCFRSKISSSPKNLGQRNLGNKILWLKKWYWGAGGRGKSYLSNLSLLLGLQPFKQFLWVAVQILSYCAIFFCKHFFLDAIASQEMPYIQYTGHSLTHLVTHSLSHRVLIIF